MNERAVFEAALEIDDPAKRSAHLDQACGNDARLREHIEGLLQAHGELGSFLVSPAAGPAAGQARTIDPPEITEQAGTIIGPYKLLQQIGEGGMGTVFMAEQTRPVRRTVALKVIKPGMDSRQVIARFDVERQSLAMMDHVNISRVFDAGATPSGRPYFVMELVHGVPITKYCDDNHLTPRERLELFVPVCQAIQHAHQKGIIHRDIKPSNVMVALYDGKPVPKVIDFGVAKATEQGLTERTLFTQYGHMVGTPEYMSPEQAEMSALGVDTRSDIYSLGALLYELLTGTTPLSRTRIREAVYADVLRMIKEEEPPKPSSRLSSSGAALASISAQRHIEPAKLAKLVRGELDWIVMKALEKDRARRYVTANAFAADVQHYLADEPVLAGPPSAVYRFRKFARRNRVALTAVVTVSVALLVGTGVSVWQAIEATTSRELARENAVKATSAYRAEKAQRAKAVGAQKVAQQRRQEAESNLAFARDAVDSFCIQLLSDRWLHTRTTAQSRVQTMDKALQFLKRFAEEPRTTPAAKYARAMAFYRIGDIQYEMANDEGATQSSQKAIAILGSLSASYPNEARYLHQLANGYWRLGARLDHQDLEHGKEAYLRAIELFDALESRFGAIQDESRHDRHVSGLEFDRECGCFGWYRYAPTFMWRSLAWEQEKAGLIEEAEAAYRKALALAKQVADEFPQGYPRGAQGFHAALGGFLKRQGLPGSEEQLRQSLELLRREPIATTDEEVRHAILLNDLGNPDEAVRYWKRALWDLSGLGSWQTRVLLEFLVSCPEAQFEAFGPEEAVELAMKAVELYPGWAGNWGLLRRVAHRAGGHERALSSLQTALERMPHDAAQRWPGHLHNAWTSLSQAYREVGDFEAAIRASEQALQISGGN